jgi:hypothetical protein
MIQYFDRIIQNLFLSSFESPVPKKGRGAITIGLILKSQTTGTGLLFRSQ